MMTILNGLIEKFNKVYITLLCIQLFWFIRLSNTFVRIAQEHFYKFGPEQVNV